MMSFANLYLVIGAVAGVIAAIVVLLSELKPSQEKSFLEYLDPKRRSLSYRIRSRVLLPIGVGLLFFLGWPILGTWLGIAGLLDLWRIFLERRRAARRKSQYQNDIGDEIALNELVPKSPQWYSLLKIDHCGASVDIESLERREWIQDPNDGVPERPFGHLHSHWQRLLRQREDGDHLHPFQFVAELNRYQITAYEGYALVRQGHIVDAIACRSVEHT